MSWIKGIIPMFMKVLVFALVWWVMTNGALQSWLIGGGAIVLATLAAKKPATHFTIRYFKLVMLIPFFLKQSILGGVDVARRALQPSMPIDPILVECPLRLPPGSPQVFMTNMVSLLPGTLSATLENNRLKMHVLDQQSSYMKDYLLLEEKVAELFSVPVQNTGAGELL
ncbi:Na+/H+ antiporter subunit E [Sedimenticola selenatireducens]|nr:Na+/H+ antiporter subunit E [Sedimenticola selenatireducens]